MIFRRRGVRRLPDGGLRVTLSPRERATLAALPAQIEPVVTGADDDEGFARLRARLYPAAYDDEELEREYRELADEELVQGRVTALETFTRTIAGGATSGGSWSVDLDPDEAVAWLGVVNDARLVLADVVGITTEAQWEAGPDPRDPASLLLYYLGWLEEELVATMMGSLPDA